MKTYYIDYGTGAGNEYADTLEEAMKLADENCSYSQCSIEIYEVNKFGEVSNKPVAKREWCGVAYNIACGSDDEEDIIDFGDFGYYGEWNFND